MIYTILIVVQVIVAVSLVVLILLQHGKGADAGAAFGSGASGTVFGAKGSANFMSHATAGLATVFMLISLALAYLVNGAATPTSNSVTDQLTRGSGPAATSTQTHEPKKAANKTPAAGAQKENKPSAPSSDSGNKEDNTKKGSNELKIPD